MNIQAFFPPREECPEDSSTGVWTVLMDLRTHTFKGFAEVEKTKGFLQPSFSFSTSKGQDALRILLFRTLEEVAESLMSTDEAHRKEELIDAINFLLCTSIVDTEAVDQDKVIQTLHDASTRTAFIEEELSISDLGFITRLIGGELAETFRNRSWMHQAQDIYFAGVDEYLSTLARVMIVLLGGFNSFTEFYAYYVAKDRVLQFRLQTYY